MLQTGHRERESIIIHSHTKVSSQTSSTLAGDSSSKDGLWSSWLLKRVAIAPSCILASLHFGWLLLRVFSGIAQPLAERFKSSLDLLVSFGSLVILCFVFQTLFFALTPLEVEVLSPNPRFEFQCLRFFNAPSRVLEVSIWGDSETSLEVLGDWQGI